MPCSSISKFLRLAAVAFSISLVGCRPKTASPPSVPPPPAPPSGTTSSLPPIRDNSSLLIGNPSRADKSANNRLLQRPQYAMSYNAAKGQANWVAWHLDKNDLGKTDRSDFRPDSLLPEAQQIRPTDYRSSGFDRGHICPSGDRTKTETANEATFVMSNMLPQTPELNQRVWKDLEDYCRQLVDDGNELYIVAGGVGSSGKIAKGKVNVPAACWKIVVVLPRGNNDLGRIARETRVIAVLMPNTDKVGKTQWPQWATTVDRLEKTTGYDFLSNVPDDIESALQSKKDVGELSNMY